MLFTHIKILQRNTNSSKLRFHKNSRNRPKPLTYPVKQGRHSSPKQLNAIHALNRTRLILALLVSVYALALPAGCAQFPGGAVSQIPSAGQTPLVGNPLYVATTNEELVWERAVDVVHDFNFAIERENRLAKVIQTSPKVGASLFEPWHKDAVGFTNRLEGTLQSVRRTVQISMQPDDRGSGYVVNVAAYKEIEDLPGLAANSAGAATFEESHPLSRDLNPVVGQTTPSQWVPAGRDPLLEQAILARLKSVYSQ